MFVRPPKYRDGRAMVWGLVSMAVVRGDVCIDNPSLIEGIFAIGGRATSGATWSCFSALLLRLITANHAHHTTQPNQLLLWPVAMIGYYRSTHSQRVFVGIEDRKYTARPHSKTLHG